MENQEYTKESVALSQEEATVESQSLSKSIPNVDENALKEREAAAVALEGKLAALQQELAAKESGLAQKAIYLDELFASLTEQEKSSLCRHLNRTSSSKYRKAVSKHYYNEKLQLNRVRKVFRISLNSLENVAWHLTAVKISSRSVKTR